MNGMSILSLIWIIMFYIATAKFAFQLTESRIWSGLLSTLATLPLFMLWLSYVI